MCKRDSWDTLLCTGLALPHLIRPFSCFSLACTNIDVLSVLSFLLSFATFQFSLFSSRCAYFHPSFLQCCSFLPPLLPCHRPSKSVFPFCGIVSQKPVCGILLRELSHRQLSEKLLLKALRGAATWPTVIPKQPFIRHATLVSVTLSVQLEDLWHLMGARYGGQSAEMGMFQFPGCSCNLKRVTE